MVRWIRIIALVLVALGFVALGVAIGLYLVANWRWVPIETPESLRSWLGDTEREVWLPALLGGWLIGVLGLGAVLAWGMFYVWRRRQSEGLVRRLERELAELRNLPFKRPAPIEDLPGDDEEPDELDDRGEAVAADPVADYDADDFDVEDDPVDEHGDGEEPDRNSVRDSDDSDDDDSDAGEPDATPGPRDEDGGRRDRDKRAASASDIGDGRRGDEPRVRPRQRTRTGVGD